MWLRAMGLGPQPHTKTTLKQKLYVMLFVGEAQGLQCIIAGGNLTSGLSTADCGAKLTALRKYDNIPCLRYI